MLLSEDFEKPSVRAEVGNYYILASSGVCIQCGE